MKVTLNWANGARLLQQTFEKNSVPVKKESGQNRPLKVGLEADSFEAAGGGAITA